MEKPIVKQDINFLDKPLWFQDIRHDGLGFVWTDIEGYEYRTGHKPPDKVDIIILLYLLMKSQKQNYADSIETTKHEILKRCGFSARDNKYYERVEESLERWKNIAIKFHGTFYDNREYITIGFGIIDDYEIDRETRRVRINFNKKWLLKIKESTFFKYLNFEYYKALKRPLSRRLYEILCKTFKGRNEWSIGLAKLGTKLTMYGREVSYREGGEIKTKKVVFASDVLVALKPALNEINRLAQTEGIGEKTGIPPEDIFRIEYEITGEKQERTVTFRKIQTGRRQTVRKEDAPQIQPHVADIKEEIQPPVIYGAQYEALLKLIPEKHRERESVTELVRQYFEDSGFEHVKWNILYSNNNAKDNYLSYLSLSLKNNWGLRFREEMELTEQEEQERLKAEAEKKRKAQEAAERRAAEEKRKAEEEAELKRQKEEEKRRLLEFYNTLSDDEKNDIDIKTGEALNSFEKKRLAEHRRTGGEMPGGLLVSLESAKLRVLKEITAGRSR